MAGDVCVDLPIPTDVPMKIVINEGEIVVALRYRKLTGTLLATVDAVEGTRVVVKQEPCGKRAAHSHSKPVSGSGNGKPTNHT